MTKYEFLSDMSMCACNIDKTILIAARILLQQRSDDKDILIPNYEILQDIIEILSIIWEQKKKIKEKNVFSKLCGKTCTLNDLTTENAAHILDQCRSEDENHKIPNDLTLEKFYEIWNILPEPKLRMSKDEFVSEMFKNIIICDLIYMSTDTAARMLDEWRSNDENHEIPDDLTPEEIAEIWNKSFRKISIDEQVEIMRKRNNELDELLEEIISKRNNTIETKK